MIWPGLPPFVETHRAVYAVMPAPLFDPGAENATLTVPAPPLMAETADGRPGAPAMIRPSFAGATAAGEAGGFPNGPIPRAFTTATRQV